MPTIGPERRALVISYSDISSDPRVRRQVDWLAGSGWTIDTLGLGPHPTAQVGDHFAVRDPERWLTTKWGTAVAHLVMPRRRRYRRMVTDRIPSELRDRVRAGEYDLLLFNELEFLAWLSDRRDFTPSAGSTRVHLDLHEFHTPRQRRRTFGGWLTGSQHRWLRRHIAHPAIDSRTVVNEPIGRLYESEFGLSGFVAIRNVPPFVRQPPSDVDVADIRLLFHGMASFARGFSEILDAMRSLPDRFSMTFMLMPNPPVHSWLRAQIETHPARERLHIVPPAPMREIAQRINEYDVEVIFYPPAGTNVVYALPNKFFESIQARLGIVTGESPAMAELVREYGVGVVVPGFEGADLASTLREMTRDDIVRMKAASDAAAGELNAEREGAAFLAAIESPGSLRRT